MTAPGPFPSLPAGKCRMPSSWMGHASRLLKVMWCSETMLSGQKVDSCLLEDKMRHYCTTVAVQAAQAILPRNPFAMSIVPHQVTGVNCLTMSGDHDTI